MALVLSENYVNDSFYTKVTASEKLISDLFLHSIVKHKIYQISQEIQFSFFSYLICY